MKLASIVVWSCRTHLVVNTFSALLPLLQKSPSQHVIHACNFVLSPIMMQPGSQCLEQFLSSNQSLGEDVEFPVLVVSEILFTYSKKYILLKYIYMCMSVNIFSLFNTIA